MGTKNRKIGEEIQPLDLMDKIIATLNQREEYDILYGYTFDRKIGSLVKAEDYSYCVALIGDTPFNGISKDHKPFLLSEEEEAQQAEIMEKMRAFFGATQEEKEAMRKKLYTIDKDTTWRLVAIEDHEGNSKVHTRSFYKERLNCIAKNLRYSEQNAYGECRMYMDFIQNPEGQWIHKHLNTSNVFEVTCEGTRLVVSTRNSVYILEKEEMEEPEYQDAAELIELYFDDSYEHFCRGTYYDEEKRPHDLVGHTHSGMFTDTYLIGLKDEYGFGSYVCRYYLGNEKIEFYDTLYNQQDYSTRMLIHNTGNTPLQIRFESYHATWTIQPGESKSIMPLRADGADEE